MECFFSFFDNTFRYETRRFIYSGHIIRTNHHRSKITDWKAILQRLKDILRWPRYLQRFRSRDR